MFMDDSSSTNSAGHFSVRRLSPCLWLSTICTHSESAASGGSSVSCCGEPGTIRGVAVGFKAGKYRTSETVDA